ncbi:MAG: hypothetical protein R3A51_20015 [Nannocystaceae bacterium]|nr:hypothetical protein [Myxococcales bacterium]
MTMSRSRTWPFGLLALALACANAERSQSGDDDPLPPPTPRVEAPPGPTAALTLRAVSFAEGAMQLELVDAPHDTHAWDQGGVLSQTVALGDADVLRILVRAGEGESLASLRREHPRAAEADLKPGRVCDGVARRLELREPEEIIECIEYADGRPSAPGYTPPMTIVAQEFRSGPLDVVATWELPTALRERYRDEEARFFASFRCGAAPALAVE